MAQFNYNQMQAQRAQHQQTSNQEGDRPVVHFMNEYLKDDPSSIVVRFPYHSMEDVTYETVHLVMDYPKFTFGKSVRCAGENCPLCARGDKLLNKFYVKLKAYIEKNGKIEAVNVVWERPAAYADIDLKGLFDEYGDLTKCLFRIKRTGQKTETRYTTNLVFNNAIYNDNTCSSDLSELADIDASKILSKSYEQYQNALHPELAQKAQAAEEVPVKESATPVEEEKPAEAPTYAQVRPQPTYQQPQPTPTAQPERKKYTF